MLVTASPAPAASCCLAPGRGLELIDGLIEPYDGTRGIVDDGDCRGKTVYVAVSRAPDPKGIQ